MHTCPQCDIALTKSEAIDAHCPSCGAELPALPQPPAPTEEEPERESSEPHHREVGGYEVLAYLLIGLGVLMNLAGIALYVGNLTGWFPSFPYAGTFLVVVGTLVIFYARNAVGYKD